MEHIDHEQSGEQSSKSNGREKVFGGVPVEEGKSPIGGQLGQSIQKGIRGGVDEEGVVDLDVQLTQRRRLLIWTKAKNGGNGQKVGMAQQNISLCLPAILPRMAYSAPSASSSTKSTMVAPLYQRKKSKKSNWRTAWTWYLPSEERRGSRWSKGIQ